MEKIYLAIVLSPLIGSIIAGLFGKQIGRAGAHWVTNIGVAVSCLLSFYVFKDIVIDGGAAFNGAVYTWAMSGGIVFEIGFLVDRLTAMMMLVVTFVSLMVHIYTIGYMKDDPGYQRFFCYISLFTFSMLMLVMANNFMQLFFGWEAVGLVSYLLIGFWYKKDTAIYANLKAFMVNRVGDFGFLLGIAVILMYFGTLDYAEVFGASGQFAELTVQVIPGWDWNVMTLICILLFIGAMGKSAQVPLHVWLPDSMEGPTPISALIHAATMVTAGVYLVARMSPLFEWSETALSLVMIVGAVTALFMGILGLIQNDIKRVVAYSTLSQLGYMVVALGASAYASGLFHLMTHAFFKALLFLAAGSVIMAMHHEQDIRKMGGLRKYMPITYFTALIGSLALIGFPGFSGFFSKDAIIEAVKFSDITGSGIAYIAVLLGVFITALYTFRMFFLVFHGKERMDEHTRSHLKESPLVITIPLILLAIPSIAIGGLTIGPVLFGDYFGSALVVFSEHDVLAQIGQSFTGAIGFVIHGFMTPAVYLSLAGLGTAYYIYMVKPEIAENCKTKYHAIYDLLDRNYGIDDFNDRFFAGGSRKLANVFYRVIDTKIIDGFMVNGTANAVGWWSGAIRKMQSGYLYHYAFAMILGLTFLLSWIFVI